jgi:hypothetical protein
MANSKSVQVKPFTSHGCGAFGANLVKRSAIKLLSLNARFQFKKVYILLFYGVIWDYEVRQIRGSSAACPNIVSKWRS